ncbi:Cytochrome c, class III, conserved region [Desulfovibrio sp. X2]|uniref:cytochrome c3 family protein n=1 Tax=Desulfovibrio sp. X2 TaxID=941449 RepID=UPI000358BAB5|nr:cytochrome c3 family protein [Desulfovibrio sp. X2]EPR41663.1 Cytochrome c, class III, conserved region [Desulfovibrio sp. X2]
MKQLLRILVSLAVFALLPALLAAYEVPAEIVIKRPKNLEAQSSWVGSVQFPHGLHAVMNPCRACHHMETDSTLGNFLPCTQCHNQPGVKGSSSFYLAFHNSRTTSCLGCHKEKRLKREAMPPISCTRGCHKLKQGGKS